MIWGKNITGNGPHPSPWPWPPGSSPQSHPEPLWAPGHHPVPRATAGRGWGALRPRGGRFSASGLGFPGSGTAGTAFRLVPGPFQNLPPALVHRQPCPGPGRTHRSPQRHVGPPESAGQETGWTRLHARPPASRPRRHTRHVSPRSAAEPSHGPGPTLGLAVPASWKPSPGAGRWSSPAGPSPAPTRRWLRTQGRPGPLPCRNEPSALESGKESGVSACCCSWRGPAAHERGSPGLRVSVSSAESERRGGSRLALTCRAPGGSRGPRRTHGAGDLRWGGGGAAFLQADKLAESPATPLPCAPLGWKRARGSGPCRRDPRTDAGPGPRG